MTARKSSTKKKAPKKVTRGKPIPPKPKPTPPRKATAAKSSWASGRAKLLEETFSPTFDVVELCKDRLAAKQTILVMRDEIRRLRDTLDSIKE